MAKICKLTSHTKGSHVLLVLHYCLLTSSDLPICALGYSKLGLTLLHFLPPFRLPSEAAHCIWLPIGSPECDH